MASQVISQFKGTTVTYVNNRAFSAGAFIAAATQKILTVENGRPVKIIGHTGPDAVVEEVG